MDVTWAVRGPGVAVGVAVAVGLGVAVEVGVGAGVRVGDGVGVAVGVAVASNKAVQLLLVFIVTCLSVQSGSPLQPANRELVSAAAVR